MIFKGDLKMEAKRIVKEQTLQEAIDEAKLKGFSNMPWWFGIPKANRFHTGDVVYNQETDKFCIFLAPTRKEGKARVRLIKDGKKNETYTRDWFVDVANLTLVKHGDTFKRGFGETDTEYIRRTVRHRAKSATPRKRRTKAEMAEARALEAALLQKAE